MLQRLLVFSPTTDGMPEHKLAQGGYRQLLRRQQARRPTLEEVTAECRYFAIQPTEDLYIQVV